MKKFALLSLLLLVIVVSCSPEPELHVHKYDAVTQECTCGHINEDVIAFIGNSNQEASARFVSLQAAVDYLASLNSSRDAVSNNLGNIIHLAKNAAGDGVVINSTNVDFDFGDFSYTFTGTLGIQVNGNSEVSIKGNELLGENVSNLIDVKSGSLKTEISFTGAISIGDEGSLKINEGTVKITGFVVDGESKDKIELKTKEISIVDVVVAKEIAQASTNESTTQVKVESHVHVTGTDLKINDTMHWYECTECNAKLLVEEHKWDEGQVSKPANCNEDGILEYACDVCNTTKTDVIPAFTHDFSCEKAEAEYLKTSATCLNAAVYYISCTHCEEKGTETFVFGKALGHDFSAEIVAPEYLKTSATCLEPAVYYKSCTHCKEKGTATFNHGEALGHDYHKTSTVDATAETDGYSVYTCSRCNGTYQGDVVPKLGHTYSSNATWTWDGFDSATVSFECATCEGTENAHSSDSFDALITSNITKVNTCLEDGTKTYTASFVFNGTTFTDIKYEQLDALTHDFSAETVEAKYLKTSATCLEPAVYYKSCSHCGDQGTETFISGEALGHDYHKTSTVDATAETDGYSVYTCSRCNDSYQADIVAKLGHVYSSSSAIWTWNGFSSASLVFECTTCEGTEDAHYSQSFNAVITSEITKASSCTENGIRTYTATYVLNGTTCTDTKQEQLDKLVHDFTGTQTVAKYLKSAATCLDKAVYYKSCVLCGEKGTETFSNGEPLNHDKSINYNWSSKNNHFSCTADLTCSRCDYHETETSTATAIDYADSSFTEKGYTKYKAVFTNPQFSAQTYKDEIAKLVNNGKLVEILSTRNTKPYLKYETIELVKWKLKKVTHTYTIKQLANAAIGTGDKDTGLSTVISLISAFSDKDYIAILNTPSDLNYFPYLRDEFLQDFLNDGDKEVQVVRFTYTTTNLEGEETLASALAFFPLSSDYTKVPIYSAQRTIIVEKEDAPSELGNLFATGSWTVGEIGAIVDKTSLSLGECFVSYMIAQTGFITVIPDGLGFGVNDDVPSFGLNASGRVFADAIYACEQLCSQLSGVAQHNGEVYLAGYSEGGYITMATAKQMTIDGHEPDGISCGDGCYAMSEVALKDILSADETFAEPFFIPMMFRSLDAKYSKTNSAFEFDYVIYSEEPYTSFSDTIYSYIDGSHSKSKVNKKIIEELDGVYEGPSSILSADFLAQMDSESCMGVFRAQDAYRGFNPTKCKINLVHNTLDDVISIENAYSAIEYFEENGCGSLVSIDEYEEQIFVEDTVHDNAATPAFVKAYEFIYDLAKPHIVK